jgi:Ca2+-binding RTX toxin-like protein
MRAEGVASVVICMGVLTAGVAGAQAFKLVGTKAGNLLFGAKGPDKLIGKAGGDLVKGRAGKDSLSGERAATS